MKTQFWLPTSKEYSFEAPWLGLSAGISSTLSNPQPSVLTSSPKNSKVLVPSPVPEAFDGVPVGVLSPQGNCQSKDWGHLVSASDPTSFEESRVCRAPFCAYPAPRFHRWKRKQWRVERESIVRELQQY